ncbi:MAG: glycosyltransferase [Liquorilactobacillus satsumensis]|uniref:glycosyltransferase n=1 Tax=Liquorilactobacillus satsumensis TaxID=259059 RepID=UPI0039EABB8F
MAVLDRYRAQNCVLTISLLVSNNLKTIRKCLESIKPLLQQVPSQLVAVDTVGSAQSDGSLAVAREYTDEIIHFDWCNDFAAARNTGLKAARGEWFLFLDDDEWFDDVSELVTFFNDSQARQKYRTLSYLKRDYLDLAGRHFQENAQMRCVRLTPQTSFHSRVHEGLEPLHLPLKETKAFVHHYGYVGGRGKKKVARNEQLLEAGLKTDPQDFHLWAQLVAGIGRSTATDRKMVRQKARAGLNNFLATDTPRYDDYRNAFTLVGYLMSTALLDEKWTEVLQLQAEFLPKFTLTQYEACILDAMLFQAHQKLKQPNKAQTCLDDYLLKYAWLQAHQQEYNMQQSFYFKTLVSVTNEVGMLRALFAEALKDQNYQRILHYLELIPWTEDAGVKQQLLPFVLRALYFEENSHALQQLLGLLQNAAGKLPVIFGKTVSELKQQDDIEDTKLTQLLAQTESKDPYILVQRALAAQGSLAFTQRLKDLRKQKVTCEVPYEEFFWLLCANGIDPDFAVAPLNQDVWVLTVASLVGKYATQKDELPAVITQIENVWQNTSRKELLLASLRRSYIYREDTLLSELLPQLRPYAQNILHYAQALYLPELFAGEPSRLLPGEVRFGVYLERALGERDAGNLDLYFANLRWGLDCYEAAKKLVERLLKEYEGQQVEQQQVNAELLRLGNQVKAQILELLKNRQTAQARPLLAELQELLPQDENVQQLQALCQAIEAQA